MLAHPVAARCPADCVAEPLVLPCLNAHGVLEDLLDDWPFPDGRNDLQIAKGMEIR